MTNNIGLIPCCDGGITVGYSWTNNGKSGHHAIDIGWNKKQNVDVMAWQDGTVLKVWTVANGGDMGNCVLLEHNYSDNTKRWSIYMHLLKSCVKVGQNVTMGQVIGIRGNTGYSHGTHLHFAITELLPKSYTYTYARFYAKCTFNPYELCYVDTEHDWSNWLEEKKGMPADTLAVGDKVQILAQGNSASSGKGVTLSKASIGWKRTILAVYDGKAFPYRVGSGNATTGYYKEEQLKKL